MVRGLCVLFWNSLNNLIFDEADAGFGGRLGEALPEDIRFERQPDGGKAFARFAGKDGGDRMHTLVDYAHACRRSPDSDEFEVFIPLHRK